ncbi:MAG: site-2 protease family protein [Candidatus Micrarchaeota archaeon]|nr:site-2 protease family protein [Candidatus Micrarchaeota archaeon]
MNEIEEMLISMIAIMVAFSIALWGIGVFFQSGFVYKLLIIGFTVGIGFMTHEMGHKYAAEKFGSPSRFVMWPQGLLLMFLLAPFGFIFAAPGAVYIFKRMGRVENGIVSLAGPVMNMMIYVIFAAILILSGVFNFALSEPVFLIAVIGMQINALLATFNLLPIFILDGAKVMNWDFKIWLAAFILSLLMLFNYGTIASFAA